MHPAGIEPTSTVPKTGTLSVELRVQASDKAQKLAFVVYLSEAPVRFSTGALGTSYDFIAILK